MSLEGWVTMAEAAARSGRSVAAVRRLAASGEIVAARLGSRWLVRVEAISHIARARPVGRPFSPRVSWALLAQLAQRTWSPLHREERARLGRYLSQPSSVLIERLRGRATRHCLSVAGVRLGDLADDGRFVLGGQAALSAALGTSQDLATVWLYVRASLEEQFFDSSYAVPDLGAPNCYLRVVDDEYWPFDEGERYVWPAVGVLDCLDDASLPASAVQLWPKSDVVSDGSLQIG